MSIKKMYMIAVGAAVLTMSASVFAELEFKPYGAAKYHFRGQWWTATDADDNSASTFDNLHLIGWYAGTNVKYDEQLSFQFRIGNDWGVSELVTYANNNAASLFNNPVSGAGAVTRVGFNNLYVHLANATWNPGYLYLSAGVIEQNSGSALDLLERSLATGRYEQAIYWSWNAAQNNSILGLKLGVPILKEDVKITAELTTSIIDRRTQTYLDGTSLIDEPKSNPSSWLFILNVPVAAGNFKVTPEFASVVNRNYNPATEKGDQEIVGGLSASYKVSEILSLGVSGAYGQVSNRNSEIGSYGNTYRGPGSTAPADYAPYDSKGFFGGIGGTLKAGPGTIALDVKYQNSVNDADDDIKKLTNVSNIIIDPRYTIAVHPKFTIAPRYRVYVNTYTDKPAAYVNQIEQRPEITLIGTF
jgi:hypothetical protein